MPKPSAEIQSICEKDERQGRLYNCITDVQCKQKLHDFKDNWKQAVVRLKQALFVQEAETAQKNAARRAEKRKRNTIHESCYEVEKNLGLELERPNFSGKNFGSNMTANISRGNGR